MINETKLLLGGMDKGNSPESVDKYDYSDAHNIRNIGTDESEGNYTTNLEGTNLITTSLPLGQNKGIGGNKFENIGKAYHVRFNSAGYHQIVEFDYNLNQETVIFENITDSEGYDVLKWDADMFFTDVRLLDEKFLILNCYSRPIYCLEVELFKKYRGVRPVIEDDLLLAKKPSLSPPKAEYLSDNGRTSNNLRGSLFQFRNELEYIDFRTSSWSTISKRVVPENEPADGYGQSVQLYNVLRVKVDIGSDRVENINVAVRIGDGNWLQVKTKKRSEIVVLPYTTATISPYTPEGYNPATNEYSFLFYNDGMYPVLDQVQVESNYDHMPTTAETVEIINGNILAVGGIEEGYDKVEVPDVNLTVTTYNPNITNTVENNTNLFVNSIGNKEYLSSSLQFRTLSTITLRGTPKAGDEITIKLAYKNQSIIVQAYSTTLTSTQEAGGIPSVYQLLATILPNSSANNERVNFYTTGWLNANDRDKQLEVRSVDIVQKSIGTITTKSIATLKSSSSYQLALSYVDSFGKYFPLVTDDRFIVKTQSLAEAQGLLNQITWDIPVEAPKGAASYQWLITENQTHQNWKYLTGILDTAKSDTTVLTFDMKSLARFYANENETQVNYSFTKGDRATFYLMTDGNSNTPLKYFRFPFIDLDIVDFKIDVNDADPTDVKYYLKVRNTDLLSQSEIEGKEILMEVYTPKKRALDTNSLLFFEIGEQFPIVNGLHSVTTGVIKEADNYFRGRLYESTVTSNQPISYLVEDPNFSDNYPSKFYNFGRARSENDEVGKVFRKASIRYSDEYIKGSKFNGLNRFFTERIYGEQGGQTTSKYGAIKRLEMRNDGLVCIQEFKVGVIPVYKSIIYDNTDTSLVADSGKIFNSVQYRIGSYGCGIAKESIAVSRDGLIYFIDSNNCVPCRDGYAGLDVIDVNMKQYFIDHIQNAVNSGSKLIGYVDDLYREYNLTTEDKRGVLTTLRFEDSIFTDNLIIDFSLVENLSSDHGLPEINQFGEIRYTPDTDYLGEDEIRFTYFGKQFFLPVLVEEGNPDPEPFFFNPVVNQPEGVVVESNDTLVTGIDVSSPISIVGGEYSINGSAWTSSTGTINDNDLVKVRTTSSTTGGEMVNVILTVGSRSATFSVTTTTSGATEYINIWNGITREGMPDPNANYAKFAIHISLEHPIPVEYESTCTITYQKQGTDKISPPVTSTVAPDATSNPLVWSVTDADKGEFAYDVISDVLETSIQDGETVMCSDGFNRIAKVPLRLGSLF